MRWFICISLGVVISIFCEIRVSPIEIQNEMPICRPEKGEVFVPIFYYSNINYPHGIVRKSEEIWKSVTQIEKNINTKGWIEMLEAVVEDNDYYYEQCASPEGNWCRRELFPYIAVDRGIQFKCSPRFKVVGTFQYHSVITELLNTDCSFYQEKDKCNDIVGCFWYEEKNPRCISKPPRRPLMSAEECERIYKETTICPRECKMLVTSTGIGGIERKCIESYCEDWRDPAACKDYPDKCKWVETDGNCINAYDCSLYSNSPEQCKRTPICKWSENSCYPYYIRWQQFLVFHYNKLFKKLSPSVQQNYLNKFLCNVAKLNSLDLETLVVEYNGVGCGGLPCAWGNYSKYTKPVPDEWELGHEIGHNSGLGHYWYSQDSHIGGPANIGVFDTTILNYLIEDLGTKYYGRSKDRFARAGKYGYPFHIYNEEESGENEEHKLKSIVYAIEKCAQKHKKLYRAGVEGVPLKPEEFKKYEKYTDAECEKEPECLEFIKRAILYYKEYLSKLHNGPCHHCVYEECFLGEGISYHFLNYMAYNGCPPGGCRFDRYQIYRRNGEGVGDTVLEWLYSSQYPIKYEGEGVYFDLKLKEGTYFKIEWVKKIFRELAALAGIPDYRVPIFEDGAENSVNIEVFQFVKDGLYDALSSLAQQNCPNNIKRFNIHKIIENSSPPISGCKLHPPSSD